MYLSSDSEDNAPVYQHRRPGSASSSADGAAAAGVAVVAAVRTLLTDSAATDVVVQDDDDEGEPSAPETAEQAWAQLQTIDDDVDKPLDVEALRAAAAGHVDPGANKVVITETFDYAGEAVQYVLLDKM